jgi:hypothetical protein
MRRTQIFTDGALVVVGAATILAALPGVASANSVMSESGLVIPVIVVCAFAAMVVFMVISSVCYLLRSRFRRRGEDIDERQEHGWDSNWWGRD